MGPAPHKCKFVSSSPFYLYNFVLKVLSKWVKYEFEMIRNLEHALEDHFHQLVTNKVNGAHLEK